MEVEALASRHIPREADPFGLPSAGTIDLLSSLISPNTTYSLSAFCDRMTSQGHHKDEVRLSLYRLASTLGLIGGGW